MLPVQYTPKHEVVTFDGEIYIIDSSIKERFVKDCNEYKLIEIGEDYIATSSIKTIRKAKQEISILERLLIGKSDHIKRKVREKVRERELEKKENTEGSIQNIIDHFEG